MCFFNLFFIFLLLFLIRVSSAMIMYDRRTLLDIGQRYTNLIQNTLSTDPAGGEGNTAGDALEYATD